MAIRTTERAVKAILGPNYDVVNGPSLQPFIETATVLVDRVALKDISTSLMTAASLELVERYLAAHFYEHEDQITASRSTGGASGQFMGRTDMGFDGTKYGQTAKRLDATGLLVMLDQPQRPKASIKWAGKVPDDQLDADERST